MCLDNDFIISKGFSKYHKLLLYFRTHVTKASVFEQYGKSGEPLIEVHTTEGVQISEDIPRDARIQGVMGNAFDAIRQGDTFEPSVTVAVRILEIQDAVYAHARQNVTTHGPHPMGDNSIKPLTHKV